jgi:hypothetical protein
VVLSPRIQIPAKRGTRDFSDSGVSFFLRVLSNPSLSGSGKQKIGKFTGYSFSYRLKNTKKFNASELHSGEVAGKIDTENTAVQPRQV